MLVIAGATFALGQWQTHRAMEKIALQERLDKRSSEGAVALPVSLVEASEWAQRKVVMRGEWVPSGLVLIDNRIHKGAAGYHVIMPLRLYESSTHVMVNRGWIAGGGRRDRLPLISTQPGVLEIEGFATVPNAEPYELSKIEESNISSGPVRQNLVLSRIAAQQRLALQPLVILQTSPSSDALVRDWPRPDARVDTHRAYALQWYAMSVAAVVLWVLFNLRRVNAVQL